MPKQKMQELVKESEGGSRFVVSAQVVQIRGWKTYEICEPNNECEKPYNKDTEIDTQLSQKSGNFRSRCDSHKEIENGISDKDMN